MSTRKYIRSVQTMVPGIWNNKHRLYNFLTRNLGLMMEEEFNLLRRMGRIELVLDIGGNHGQSIHAIQRCAKPQMIMSFEPLIPLADALKKRFAGDSTVQIHNIGLADCKSEIVIFIPKYRYAVMDGLASLELEAVTDWLENPNLFWRYNPELLKIIENKVAVETLDSFDLTPDVVKIDVQGLEQAVVEGGIETFRRCQPLTIVECPTDDLVALFRTLNMHPYAYRNGSLHQDWRSQTNTVFLGEAMKARIGL